MITQKRLKEVIDYTPETGKLIWLKGRRVGFEAGCVQKYGYRSVMVDKISYMAHRLIWLYMEGYTPEYEVDHKDRNPSNNKWNNLRHVTPTCNMRNRGILSNNKTGVTGVRLDSRTNKYESAIVINKEKKRLGFYSNLSDAVKARWSAELKYNFPNCNTTSSAYTYLTEKGII